MKKYVKYIVLGVIAVSLYYLMVRNETEETVPTFRDYDEIVKSGVLRAITEYNSISFHADGDSIRGFHYELLTAFAKSKGLKAEITPEMSVGKQMDGVQEGRYDILANNTAVTTESKDSLLFTRPIILTKQILVQRKPEEGKEDSTFIRNQLDLANKTLHVVEASPAILRIRNLSNEIGDTIYIDEVEKYGQEQLMAMVAHGDIDYAVCDENIAKVALDDFPQLDISTAIGFSQFYSWGVNKHSPMLLDTLNTWLDKYIASKDFKKLYKKYYK